MNPGIQTVTPFRQMEVLLKLLPRGEVKGSGRCIPSTQGGPTCPGRLRDSQKIQRQMPCRPIRGDWFASSSRLIINFIKH